MAIRAEKRVNCNKRVKPVNGDKRRKTRNNSMFVLAGLKHVARKHSPVLTSKLQPENKHMPLSKNNRKLLNSSDGVFTTFNIITEHLRSKIDDAIRTFRDNTCLKFREVPVSYGGDHIKMHKGKG